VLLADPAHGDSSSRGGRDRVSEYSLGFEDALRVVAERAVAKVAVVFLRLVEPGVDRDVVVNLAAPFSLRADCVVVGVCDGYCPPFVVLSAAVWPGRPGC